ncbi:hypothetical protein SAMN04488069_11389 [Hymenobacter psychrophilus]|uniref:Uncharacterized protein n=1 Tax=Hymenobacter psychrophilus TaxID=651662 RepID=A0A1H3MP79_9BACT|nr:hypothetical protein SAMN04488069_11389 [Hymenobacter psychrophilus]
MNSLLRFALMISLVIIGKLNSTPTKSVSLSQNEEAQWIIPVYTTTVHKTSTHTASPLPAETGKFRSWRLMTDIPATDE